MSHAIPTVVEQCAAQFKRFVDRKVVDVIRNYTDHEDGTVSDIVIELEFDDGSKVMVFEEKTRMNAETGVPI